MQGGVPGGGWSPPRGQRRGRFLPSPGGPLGEGCLRPTSSPRGPSSEHGWQPPRTRWDMASLAGWGTAHMPTSRVMRPSERFQVPRPVWLPPPPRRPHSPAPGSPARAPHCTPCLPELAPRGLLLGRTPSRPHRCQQGSAACPSAAATVTPTTSSPLASPLTWPVMPGSRPRTSLRGPARGPPQLGVWCSHPTPASPVQSPVTAGTVERSRPLPGGGGGTHTPCSDSLSLTPGGGPCELHSLTADMVVTSQPSGQQVLPHPSPAPQPPLPTGWGHRKDSGHCGVVA